ncbi:hypothetical protein E2542_SST18064 [Spatholobus suberectus]|nr:hypothetical protein E2542_SST18064 [Spatholobus suberectus]
MRAQFASMDSRGSVFVTPRGATSPTFSQNVSLPCRSNFVDWKRHGFVLTEMRIWGFDNGLTGNAVREGFAQIQSSPPLPTPSTIWISSFMHKMQSIIHGLCLRSVTRLPHNVVVISSFNALLLVFSPLNPNFSACVTMLIEQDAQNGGSEIVIVALLFVCEATTVGGISSHGHGTIMLHAP